MGVAKTKTLICAFAFAFEKCWFSHDTVQTNVGARNLCYCGIKTFSHSHYVIFPWQEDNIKRS